MRLLGTGAQLQRLCTWHFNSPRIGIAAIILSGWNSRVKENAWRLSERKRVFLALTPLDGGRRDLARYRGEKHDLPLPRRRP